MKNDSYKKPQVTKIEVDADIMRMFTREGFVDLFWERLQVARRTDPSITQEAVFDELNAHWSRVMGSLRYSCYDSFRQRLSKK
jgi:hypothetical protein